MRLFWGCFWALGFSSICCALKQSNGFMTQIKLWIMGGEHTERKTKANWEHAPVPYSDNSSVLCLQKKKKTCFEKCVFRARHLTHFSRVQKVKNDKLQVQGETDPSGHSKIPKILHLTSLAHFSQSSQINFDRNAASRWILKGMRKLRDALESSFRASLPPLFYEQKQA